MTDTVKARIHHGAESLDITIPVKIVRSENISEGDVFEVEKEEREGELVLNYRRVYSKN